jgi:hypothetical protein
MLHSYFVASLCGEARNGIHYCKSDDGKATEWFNVVQATVRKNALLCQKRKIWIWVSRINSLVPVQREPLAGKMRTLSEKMRSFDVILYDSDDAFSQARVRRDQ